MTYDHWKTTNLADDKWEPYPADDDDEGPRQQPKLTPYHRQPWLLEERPGLRIGPEHELRRASRGLRKASVVQYLDRPEFRAEVLAQALHGVALVPRPPSDNIWTLRHNMRGAGLVYGLSCEAENQSLTIRLAARYYDAMLAYVGERALAMRNRRPLLLTDEMIEALEADGKKLRQITSEDYGPSVRNVLERENGMRDRLIQEWRLLLIPNIVK